MTTRPPRPSAKREQILRAAADLFLTQGAAGTSMDAVVAQAGVSKQTLYRYFPSKTDLLSSVMLDLVRMEESFPPPDAPVTDLAALRAVLLSGAHDLLDRLLTPRTIDAFRLLAGDAFRIPQLRAALRSALPVQLINRTADLLADAAARGLIQVPDPELAARLYVGPVFSFVALNGILADETGPAPTREDLAYLVDSFLLAVAVRP